MSLLHKKSVKFFAHALLLLLISFPQPSWQILSIHRTGRSTKYPPTNTSFESLEEIHQDFVKEDKDKNEDFSSSSEVLTNIYSRRDAWLFSVLSAVLVGLSGIVPLLILPKVENEIVLDKKAGGARLKRLLSFAVGGLLGDVFLHLLPESWEHLEVVSPDGSYDHWPMIWNGLWILAGLISFCTLEKIFPDFEASNNNGSNADHSGKDTVKLCNMNGNNNKVMNGSIKNGRHCSNGISNGHAHIQSKPLQKQPKIKMSGYLNLLANCIDNFTHGLAVGGSYLVSCRVGFVTTCAILLHEIPHEVGDFAILLRAGFTRWHAAKLQVLTATGGLVGVFVALLAESAKKAGDQVAWILPFTSGGFIYVALCTVLPDILKETSARESVAQVFLVVLGIVVMYGVGFIG
ncbi:unnamed protein product [Clavelina lepadiformis]|uniref:Zinc transporter ZIP13 n=1 Tax=Clavelina lepadiformis TaxID=159417 RepID=A0ABP0FQS6_CLALP